MAFPRKVLLQFKERLVFFRINVHIRVFLLAAGLCVLLEAHGFCSTHCKFWIWVLSSLDPNGRSHCGYAKCPLVLPLKSLPRFLGKTGTEILTLRPKPQGWSRQVSSSEVSVPWRGDVWTQQPLHWKPWSQAKGTPPSTVLSCLLMDGRSQCGSHRGRLHPKEKGASKPEKDIQQKPCLA